MNDIQDNKMITDKQKDFQTERVKRRKNHELENKLKTVCFYSFIK